jgi:Ca2+-binding RTX toxin-like protein
MWDTSGGGSLDTETTANTPQHLYLERIEVFASGNGDPTAVVNDTRIPMWASGWFAAIAAGPNGFYGGDGPDCIAGSLLDDVIRGGGADDFVRAKDGADSVLGEDGNDTIEGGAGEDVVRGQGGVDHLKGGTGDDCHSGGLDGLRDLLDDVGSAGSDSYVAEPGVVDGEDVPTIEHVVEEGGWLTEDCL